MARYYTYDSNLRDRNKLTSTVDRKTLGGEVVTKRYFSQLDTDVYFGDQHVDEIVAIDFTIAEPKLPLYGFNSFYPNRIINGRRTVQGTFAVNFTHTMYLLNILNSIDDSVMKNEFESMIYYCPEEDSTGLGIGNSAIFNKMFDITLSYGYGFTKDESLVTYNGCYQTIVGVQIVDYRQALDTEGNPILDMYSFVAKDIRYQEKIVEEGTEEKPTDDINPTTGGDGGGEMPPEDACPLCGEPIKECICEIKVLNACIKGDMEDPNYGYPSLVNTNKPGFIVEPHFYKSSSKDDYYISLGVEGVNVDTTEITDVNVTIKAKSILDRDISFTFDSLPVGSTKAYPLVEAERELGIKLYKAYKSSDSQGYAASCSISFSANVNGKDMPGSYTTYLVDKDKCKKNK